MKKYLTFKSSGNDWLGVIPEWWEVKRLKYISYTRVSNVDKKSEDEILVRLCNYIDVYNHEFINENIEFMVATATRRQVDSFELKNGDVIITKDSETPDDIGIPAYVDLEDTRNIVCGYHLAISTPINSELLGKYLFRLFQSNFFRAYFEVSSNGITRYGLDTYSIFNAHIPLPPFSEQCTIASFLDREAGKIDHLISKKQKLIDLLKEERAAVINDAVTKGIKQKVQYRKSKLDWLSIPEHWKEIRAKNVFFESQDKAKGDEELLSVSHYTGVTPRSEKNVYMFLAESYKGYKLCKKDDLVINTMWAWMGALGVSEYDGIVSSGYGVYRFKNKNTFIPMYLNYLLRTPGYVGEYTKRSKGIHSSRWRLYPDEFFQITIICPPIEEQMEIVVYIQRETDKIDQSVTRLGKEIALLKEYRTALISEVVTGKIDVRQEVVS